MARLGDTRKCARSAGTGTTGAERRNVRRVSAGEGMSSMANSMNTAADTLANAMREVATTLRPTDVTINPKADEIRNPQPLCKTFSSTFAMPTPPT